MFTVQQHLETEVSSDGDDENAKNESDLLNGTQVRRDHEEREVRDRLRHLQRRKCRLFVMGKQETDDAWIKN